MNIPTARNAAPKPGQNDRFHHSCYFLMARHSIVAYVQALNLLQPRVALSSSSTTAAQNYQHIELLWLKMTVLVAGAQRLCHELCQTADSLRVASLLMTNGPWHPHILEPRWSPRPSERILVGSHTLPFLSNLFHWTAKWVGNAAVVGTQLALPPASAASVVASPWDWIIRIVFLHMKQLQNLLLVDVSHIMFELFPYIIISKQIS